MEQTNPTKFPGVTQHSDGRVSFELTQEEREEIHKFIEMMKKPGGDWYTTEDIKKMFWAIALHNHAWDQIFKIKHGDESPKDQLFNKAIAAISKAYNFYSHPIYLFDMANFIEMQTGLQAAKEVYQMFLEKQSKYVFEKKDEMILIGRNFLLLGQCDLETAIKQAEQKIS